MTLKAELVYRRAGQTRLELRDELCQSSGLVLCPFDTTTVCGPLGKTCPPVVIDGLTVGACL